MIRGGGESNEQQAWFSGHLVHWKKYCLIFTCKRKTPQTLCNFWLDVFLEGQSHIGIQLDIFSGTNPCQSGCKLDRHAHRTQRKSGCLGELSGE